MCTLPGGGCRADLRREGDASAIYVCIRKGLGRGSALPAEVPPFQTVTCAQLFQVNPINGLTGTKTVTQPNLIFPTYCCLSLFVSYKRAETYYLSLQIALWRRAVSPLSFLNIFSCSPKPNKLVQEAEKGGKTISTHS